MTDLDKLAKSLTKWGVWLCACAVVATCVLASELVWRGEVSPRAIPILIVPQAIVAISVLRAHLKGQSDADA